MKPLRKWLKKEIEMKKNSQIQKKGKFRIYRVKNTLEIPSHPIWRNFSFSAEKWHFTLAHPSSHSPFFQFFFFFCFQEHQKKFTFHLILSTRAFFLLHQVSLPRHQRRMRSTICIFPKKLFPYTSWRHSEKSTLVAAERFSPSIQIFSFSLLKSSKITFFFSFFP